MTPFSYDYKNRTLRGVIVKGQPYYDVTSVLECVGYSKPKSSSGWGGKMYYLLDMMPSEETTRIKSRLYCTEAGVRYLHTNLMAKKGIRNRAEKEAFFQWFEYLMIAKPTATHDDASTATLPEQVPADDAAPTVEDLQKMLAERDHKLDVMSEQLSTTAHINLERQETIDRLQAELNEERACNRNLAELCLFLKNLKEA